MAANIDDRVFNLVDEFIFVTSWPLWARRTFILLLPVSVPTWMILTVVGCFAIAGSSLCCWIYENFWRKN